MDVPWLDINDPIVQLREDIAARASEDDLAALNPRARADIATCGCWFRSARWPNG